LIKGNRLLVAALFYFLVCVLTSVIIKPFSVINFIGPAAGIASAFTLVWGAGVLASIIIGTVSFSLFLVVTKGTSIDFPIMIIAILAISLQSFWTKQLVYRLVRQQRWLRSRAVLFSFIIKIGPLAGIVSASSVIVISMLDIKMLGSSIGYVFFASWTGSILTTIFFTPILLFTQGTQQLSLSKRTFVIFASILGSIAIALLFKASQNSHQYQRVEVFDDATQAIELLINEEIEMVNEQVQSLVALFKASKYVSLEEFTTFSAYIYRKNSSIRALEWIPLVTDSQRQFFESEASKEIGVPLFIKQQLNSGQVVKSDNRPVYLPVYYIYPQGSNKKAFGLDLLTHPDKKVAIERAAKENKLVASAPLTLVQDNYSNPGTLVFYPVINKQTLNPYASLLNETQQNINGYILAVVQFEAFFNHTAEADLASDVSLFVQDVTTKEPFLLYGRQIEGNGRLSQSLALDVFSRKWLINITEKEPWVNQSKDWQTWAMLFGGTLGGLIFQLMILMMAAYSVELSHQVVLKTRELIAAKELSEQKNTIKSNFLQTLSGELKAPIYAIKYFVAKFRQHPTFAQAEHSIEDIANASHNLTQLIDTVVDLTEIESSAETILQLSVFDFHHFLQRVETLLNASNKENKLIFKFFINENVPHLIESDELRIQKLIVALAENAVPLLKCKNLSLSIKAHVHQFKRVTLFLVLTPFEKTFNNGNSRQDSPMLINKDLSAYSTTMAMVKELCQVFEGDVKLNQLATGMVVLSASIKVNLSPVGHVFTQNDLGNNHKKYDG